MTVFMIGVFHLKVAAQLKDQDDEVSAKEVVVVAGVIAKRAMREGGREREKENKTWMVLLYVIPEMGCVSLIRKG